MKRFILILLLGCKETLTHSIEMGSLVNYLPLTSQLILQIHSNQHSIYLPNLK